MSTEPYGEVVGPLSAELTTSSSDRLVDRGDGYDFAIGGLGFHVAISDERPYERATAQFRKDQFDTTRTTGDQSLTGMWTRGQFSFHKGAGVTYYEVLESEAVLDRFDSSVGVDVATAGEVTLVPAVQDWTATVFDISANARAVACDDTLYLGVSGTSLQFGVQGAVLSSYTMGAGSPRDVTADDTWVWVAGSATTNSVERAAKGATTGTVLYTHSTGIRDIGFVKGRLMLRDDAGSFYQVAAHPSGVLPIALASADLMFTLGGATGSEKWFFSETQAGVFIAGSGNRLIYHVTINPDGAIPTLAAPVVAAELPEGEVLRTMASYLGYVALVTSKGMRVAIQQNDGSLVYGPLIFEASVSSHGTMSASGSILYPAFGDSVYAVNLGESVGDNPLLFAYTVERTVTGARGTLRGGEIVWGNTVAKETTGDLISSGTLTTGYHRFGTLENKKFQTVRVRASGTGSVAIARVNIDGSTTSLYTMPVEGATSQDITLGMGEPAEMVGLQFTLAPSGADPTVGPTLLGYQIRALPAPKRQRMIRIPLMMMDVERRGVTPARGYQGSAWDRLEELEEMEMSGGTFVFQDFRTGEAGECFIEQIEHIGTTPPGRKGTGYGGFVFLTIRKL